MGLTLAIAAVIFWSFGSSLIFLGARDAGTWPFVAVASLAGGALQLVFRRVHHGELRTALCLPWRLWLIPLACFVVYGLAWPCALAACSPRQVFGVNLINYLWPALTVLFSACLVPGARLTLRTTFAIGLALAGLALANLPSIRESVSHRPGQGGAPAHLVLPYVLALVAALTWALYSAILVRWRDWARHYVTSPPGFVVLGLIGLLVVGSTHAPLPRLGTTGLLMTVLYGIGPLAAGYLLWEMALPQARVQTLSLVAAATPVLSTLLLCLFLRTMPGLELGIAALLVSAGIGLSMRG